MFREDATFRHRLTMVLGMAVLLLSIAIGLTTSWLFLVRLDSVVVDQAAVLTERLSEEAIVPLLVKDAESAKRETQQMSRFPGVRYVEIADTEYRVISQHGEAGRWRLAERMPVVEDGSRIAFEDDELWHFVTPVSTRPSISAAQPDPYAELPDRERLGYLHIAVEKQPIRDLWGTVMATNVLLVLFAGLAIAFWLATRVHSLTRPLANLATTMQEGLGERSAIKAPLEGAREVRDIATAFNMLMADRERYTARLETEVNVQTRQLREAYEKVVASEAYQRDLTANITHEMKSPLNTIAVYVQHTLEQLPFIDDALLAQRIREFQHIVLDRAADLKLEIDEILDQTRLEQGKTAVNVVEIDLRELLNHVEAELRPIAAQNHNTLSMELKGSYVVAMDSGLLQRMIRNVAHIACKFTKDGTVAVLVENTPTLCRVVCEDDGIGIPDEWQQRVFDKFQQVDMSRSREFPGTGLGLTITAGYCKLLGGSISLASGEGEGTRIELRIPLPVRTAPTTVAMRAVVSA